MHLSTRQSNNATHSLPTVLRDSRTESCTRAKIKTNSTTWKCSKQWAPHNTRNDKIIALTFFFLLRPTYKLYLTLVFIFIWQFFFCLAVAHIWHVSLLLRFVFCFRRFCYVPMTNLQFTFVSARLTYTCNTINGTFSLANDVNFSNSIFLHKNESALASHEKPDGSFWMKNDR